MSEGSTTLSTAPQPTLEPPPPPPDAPPLAATSRPVLLDPPQLILMDAEGPRARFVLGAERTCLGNQPSCDIQLLDQGVRGLHATVVRGQPRWTLEIELGALAGTVINGTRPPEPAPTLFDGDVIQLGRVSLQFFSGTRPVSAPAPQRRPSLVATRKVGRPHRPSLAGDLKSLSFCDLIQLLSNTMKTGELEIEARGARWKLIVKQGAPVDVKGPEADATRGFQALARLAAGRFEFHERAVRGDGRLRAPAQALLLDALRLADEATRAA